jgi:hypothetical protein
MSGIMRSGARAGRLVITDLLQSLDVYGTRDSEEPQAERHMNGINGGRHGIRTHDPGVANAVLSQLS